MNYLQDLSCYLSGPIQYDDLHMEWRENLSAFLNELGVRVLNPSRNSIKIANIHDDIHQMIEEKRYGEIRRSYGRIRNTDLRMVDKADFLIVLLDLTIKTYGTLEELFLSNRSKKPTLVVCPQGRDQIPIWFWMSLPPDHLFSSFQDVKNYLSEVNSLGGDKTGRWIFTHEMLA